MCSCKTTATVQDHYKSVPIWTLNMSFIRIFSTLMIQSNRLVFCLPREEAKVMLMWLLTVSDMALVSPSRNSHVNIPYFEGITLFPWILLKIFSLIFLPSIFCLCHTFLWSQEFSPFPSFAKASFSSPYGCSWGVPVGQRGVLPCPPVSLSSWSSRCFRGSCGDKSNLQL